MPRKQKLVVLLVLLWTAAFAASFIMSGQIDGPRNIDTGFKRLDVLVRWQLIALCLAVFTGIYAFVPRGGSRRQKIIGLIPTAATLLLVLGIAVVSIYLNNARDARIKAQPIKPVTAPAADAIAPQD